ncbi:MAG TPA: hypothetical protein VKE40_22420 [Gemmataceae bacterium]|nr:hypothetical protein [Gemmataceae bacterium]
MHRTLFLNLAILFIATGQSRGNDATEAKALLDRAIKAAGGEAVLAKFKAARFKSKGILYVGDEKVSLTSDWTYQRFDQLRSTVVLEKSDGKRLEITEVVNGDRGWLKVNNDPTEEVGKDYFQARKEQMYSNWIMRLIPLTAKEIGLTLLPETTVGDRPAVGLEATHPDHHSVKLWFDKESALVIKIAERIKDPETGKEVNQEIMFASFKEVQGRRVAHRAVYFRDGKKKGEEEITEVTLSERVDDNLFTKP